MRAARNFLEHDFVRLNIGMLAIGWIRRDLVAHLNSWPDVFEFSNGSIRLCEASEPRLSASMAQVARALAREGAIRGWRGETYAVRANPGGEVLFHVERAAMRFFGLASAAAHLNGFFVRSHVPVIWIARRAATKSIDPGMLDNLVAGGVPSGEDAWQALLRECAEEAGIPRALAEKARPAGLLQVCREVPGGLHSEVLHLHDLALAADFAPRNTDGEVSEFLPLNGAELLERIARGEMTVEAGLVAADFALRHGMIRDEDGRISAAVEACRGVTLP